jgi:predicted nucleic acid-binding protein
MAPTPRRPHGPAHLSLGHPTVARDWFHRALANRIAWTEAEPQNVAARSYLSEAELWMGVVLTHEIRRGLAQLEPGNLPRQADLALALAHCGRRDEAARQAEVVLRGAADRTAVLLPLARCFAACAAADSDDILRQRDSSRVRDLLAAVIRTGYRNSFAIRTDPDFAPFRSEPAFQALLDQLKSSSE